MMGTRFNRWFLEKISASLGADLREAILGDLEELKISAGRAVYELLGLLLRRQIQPWTSWRPWVALLGIAWPITLLLTNLSSDIASGLSIQALAYWKYGVSYGTGLTGPQEILTIVCQASAIVLWSWTAGWVLGALSARAIWLNWGLLCLVCFVHAVKLPFYFYSVGIFLIHLTFLLLFVLLPAFSGTKRALQPRQSGIKLMVLLATAVAALTGLVTLTQGWQLIALEKWSLGALHYSTPNWEERLLPLLILSWPVTYLLVATTRRQQSEAT